MDRQITTTKEKQRSARVIAYYLPQFQPLKENDEWWGKGFTEWTNVARAKPLFKGHYQPRVPADLGFYDLRLPEVREAQASLARDAGIEGFMYWHYWFGNGRRVLERTFTEVLKTGKPDYPFCLGWANHSWDNHEWNPVTQWKPKNYLIKQIYSGREDYEKHFYTLLDAFHDSRYIKVDNKPLFLVYNLLGLPNPKDFTNLWNELAVKNGLDGIHFVGRTSSTKTLKVLNAGFDAINSNGQWLAEECIRGRLLRILLQRMRRYIGGLTLDVYRYETIIKYIFNDADKLDNVYPSIIPQWDRSPRSGRRGVIYHGSTPDLFRKHVQDALNIIKHKDYQNRILFLKSWNEWGEGNYMEPDIVHGHGYLNALRNVLLGN
jgi:lipopolysaccharide biosynthesis protein